MSKQIHTVQVKSFNKDRSLRREYERKIDNKQLADTCLNLAGGGYVESQVRNAMMFQDKLLNGEEIKVRDNKIKIINTEEVECG